jgi:hypothetical protein
MTDIVLLNDTEFSPTVNVSGIVRIRRFRTYTPQLNGVLMVGGRATVRIPRPMPLAVLAGEVSVHGNVTIGLKVPTAAFRDFSHFPYSGVDPAMAWTGVNSGALKSAAAGSYSRPYASFTGPLDYPVSGGKLAWKRAAYAATGFKFASMSANKHQILDAVQFEPMPLGSTGPRAYQNARELQVVVKPTRLNYAPNPNFESGISGVSAISGATVSLGTSLCWQGTQSLLTSVPNSVTADAGCSFSVKGLIPGRRYTMSARVAIAQGCGNVYPWSSTNSTKMVWRMSFDPAAPEPATPKWRTVWVTFDATASTVSMGLNVARSTMMPGTPSLFWTDGVLVEEGSSPREYFDGSMGEDYLWESGGSPNLTRSYYYENYTERSYLVSTLLEENVPLGITSAVPQYAVLPTQ